MNALLIILFLSDTDGGRVHDKPIADATPYPLPAGSPLLQDLGFLAFTLPNVEPLMPTKKPRGEELTRVQQQAYCCANWASADGAAVARMPRGDGYPGDLTKLLA